MSERKTKAPGGTAADKQVYGRSRDGALKKKAFLARLAATCNVSESARAAGAGVSYFYTVRRIDVAFGEAWKAAVMAGYDRLEEALLARSIARLREEGDAADGPAEPPAEPPVVTIELVDGRLRSPPGADADADPEAAASSGEMPGAAAGEGGSDPESERSRDPASGPASGPAPDRVTLVDIQVALAMLKRQEALQRRGRERAKRPRPTADEVEAVLNAKLDALARRITPLGGREG